MNGEETDPIRELKLKVSELNVAVSELSDGVRRIETGLFGDADLKVRGLATKVDDLETKVEAHDRKLFLWSTVAAASGAILYAWGPKLLGLIVG